MIFPKTVNPNELNDNTLITISYSHYCEMSRWSLDYKNIPYQEVSYIPGYHSFKLGALRKNKINRSNTSYVGQESNKHSGRRKFAVPLYITKEGEYFKDSWDIVKYSMKEEITQNWIDKLDYKLGVTTRQIIYYYFLNKKNKKLLNQLVYQSSFFENLFWFIFGNKIVDSMIDLMSINQKSMLNSKKTVIELFNQVSKTLTKTPKSIIGQDHFTSTDLAFCSLGSIVIFPENYSNGFIKLPEVKELPKELQEFIHKLRSTKAGEFILNSYKEFR